MELKLLKRYKMLKLLELLQLDILEAVAEPITKDVFKISDEPGEDKSKNAVPSLIPCRDVVSRF